MVRNLKLWRNTTKKVRAYGAPVGEPCLEKTATALLRNLLEGMELEEDNVGKVHRISWLRKAAGDHTAMGSKLINVARRMKAYAMNQEEHEKVWLNHNLNTTTTLQQ